MPITATRPAHHPTTDVHQLATDNAKHKGQISPPAQGQSSLLPPTKHHPNSRHLVPIFITITSPLHKAPQPRPKNNKIEHKRPAKASPIKPCTFVEHTLSIPIHERTPAGHSQFPARIRIRYTQYTRQIGKSHDTGQPADNTHNITSYNSQGEPAVIHDTSRARTAKVVG